MIRLALAAALSGLLGTSAAAWHLRNEIAWAPVPVAEPHDTQAELVAVAVEGCARAGRDPVVGVQDGVVVVRCPVLPSLGVASVARGRR